MLRAERDGNAGRVQVRRKDVLSVWSGIRPLAKDPSATSTADAVRDHLVISDPSGLVTVTGGKWTTYRLMAQDAVDAAVEAGELQPARGCVTERLKLLGAERYSPSLFAHLAQVRHACHARCTVLCTLCVLTPAHQRSAGRVPPIRTSGTALDMHDGTRRCVRRV